MSKRSYPNYNSDKKRPKLDISISEANFPLSQNFTGSRDVPLNDNWGDENDDEILLLASQACEQACNENDITSVPDYSICMQQPYSTSTQYGNPQPSTSKTDFTFKKPSANQPSCSTANLKDKCHLISSPLHGIFPKEVSRLTEDIKISHDLDFSERIFNGHGSEIIYKQLLQIQEENNKLKSENGKLLEKCVTKEGEASILRTQLKSCQVAIDNARLEKLKAQEKVQTEWTDKFAVLNNQMQDLRTQLDFKNLEIISTKEKCKMLESSKVRLTQVTVSNNDINNSHKNNSSYMYGHDPFNNRRDKTKMSHSAVQTSSYTSFITLHKVLRFEAKNLQSYLPLALQPTQDTLPLLSNEKLQSNTEFRQNKCIIYSTYHRIPDNVTRSVTQCKVRIDCVYEDFSKIVSCIECGKEDVVKPFINIISNTRLTLEDLINQLEELTNRMTMAFKKDMDERYIEETNKYLVFTVNDLIGCSSMYKEEQAILPRRLITMLALTIKNASTNTNLIEHLTTSEKNNDGSSFIGIINKICLLFDSTYTSIMYSGYLQSVILLLHSILKTTKEEKLKSDLIEMLKLIVVSRPLPCVVCEVLGIVKFNFESMKLFCFGSSTGNLKTDLDQGVLLYKKETCPLQITLKVVETTLKCIERDVMYKQAVRVTNDLILLNSNWKFDNIQDKACDCQTVLSQVLVYGLQICASMIESCTDSAILTSLQSTSSSGINTLYKLLYKDVELNTRLGYNEGHYQLFVDICERNRAKVAVNDVYENMLTELLSTIQSTEDQDMTPNTRQQIWCDSFNQFSITE